jgi:flagellar biosynthesis/type III secretory pathway protein FliH
VEVPAGGLPAETRALLEVELRDAFERGREVGVEEGRAAAAEEVARLLREVRSALEEGLEALRGWRAEEAARVADLALRIARHVLGREPVEASGVIERVREALAAIDDGPLTLSVHPEHVEPVRAALDPASVVVQADASLAPGEARLRGPWSSADLTFDAACEVIREALGAPPGLTG